MTLTTEQEESLEEVLGHYGFPVVLELMEEILERIKREVISVPMSSDHKAASYALFAKRMQAEGAQALRNSFLNKLSAIKLNKG